MNIHSDYWTTFINIDVDRSMFPVESYTPDTPGGKHGQCLYLGVSTELRGGGSYTPDTPGGKHGQCYTQGWGRIPGVKWGFAFARWEGNAARCHVFRSPQRFSSLRFKVSPEAEVTEKAVRQSSRSVHISSAHFGQ